jgi:hypothetical protein
MPPRKPPTPDEFDEFLTEHFPRIAEALATWLGPR